MKEYLNITYYNTLDEKTRESIVTYPFNTTGTFYTYGSGKGANVATLYGYMNNASYKTEWTEK